MPSTSVGVCVCKSAALLFIYLLNFAQLYEEAGLASDDGEGEG